MIRNRNVLSWFYGRLGFLWAMVVFLLGYLLLLTGVAHFYLMPAYAALQQADPDERARLQALSALLMAVLLVVLLVGLLLTFRLRRYLVRSDRSAPTVYHDAWSESARRLRDESRHDG